MAAPSPSVSCGTANRALPCTDISSGWSLEEKLTATSISQLYAVWRRDWGLDLRLFSAHLNLQSKEVKGVFELHSSQECPKMWCEQYCNHLLHQPDSRRGIKTQTRDRRRSWTYILEAASSFKGTWTANHGQGKARRFDHIWVWFRPSFTIPLNRWLWDYFPRWCTKSGGKGTKPHVPSSLSLRLCNALGEWCLSLPICKMGCRYWPFLVECLEI